MEEDQEQSHWARWDRGFPLISRQRSVRERRAETVWEAERIEQEAEEERERRWSLDWVPRDTVHMVLGCP